jgi:hypothetical protein
MSHRTGSRLALALLASFVLALVAATVAVASEDLRSPDARDAALAAEQAQSKDLRSPDARDAARGVHPTPPPTPDSSGGLDWGYLAVGGGLVLVAVAGGTATVMRRRRRAERPAVA